MKKFLFCLVLSFAAAGCSGPVNSDGVKIIAHRGFWNCEEGGFSENSIASLRAAQDAGLWGSECDVHLTADDVIIVNHDARISGKRIRNHPFSDFEKDLLPNGERRPTFDEYLTQAGECRSTMLVVELKPQESEEVEDLLVDKVLASVKEHRMYNNRRIGFISFSKHICCRIAAKAPGFMNQYLNGDLSPQELKDLGINGMDYHFMVMRIHSNWIREAADLGISTNTWTVNNEAVARVMVSLGVGAITTNDPLMVRNLASDQK